MPNVMTRRLFGRRLEPSARWWFSRALLSMGWFDTHRFWQPYSQDYMFVWNWVVAKHTMDHFAPVPTQKVKDRYASIVAANLAVSDHDVSLGHLLDMDYFWVSVTLAEMGIPPMLGPKRVKWFCVVNHRESRRSAAKRGAPVAAQVLEDIFIQYGFRFRWMKRLAPRMRTASWSIAPFVHRGCGSLQGVGIS